ncbi:MAG: aminotransferase class IV [Bacteroidota bacterium]
MEECKGSFYLHNGHLTPVDQFDPSFLSLTHYIYEVFRVIEGKALFLEDHLQRLHETCRLSKECSGFDISELYQQTYTLLRANNMQTGNVKIVLYRSVLKETQLLIYTTVHEYPTAEQYKNGVTLSLFKGTRINPNAKVMDVKLRNATNLMKQQKDVYETLLVDKDNCITEGSRSNVFFIRAGKVITPPLEDVLPGITRKYIIEVCQALKLQVTEEKVPARSLVVMEALFISGTSRKVLPVKGVDDLTYDPSHPILLQIRKAFDDRIARYLESVKI